MFRIWFVMAGIMLLLFSCMDKDPETNVTLTIKGASGKLIYLVRIPFPEEKDTVLDSAIVIDLNHPVQFTVSAPTERLYAIKVKGSGKQYRFINDTRQVQLDINHINGRYEVVNSPASLSLKRFTDSQVVRAGEVRRLFSRIDSFPQQKEQLFQIYQQAYDSLIGHYRYYADTVKSPAAFMAVVDNIDFANDFKAQKEFYQKAENRFPGYPAIAFMHQEVIKIASIFEEEYSIGDTLPLISLPLVNGSLFSTEQLKGKFYLLDIWSTWCPQCKVYNYYKKKLYREIRGKNFEIVSIAFDDNHEKWRNYINRDSLNWIQLIDEKLWRGTAANSLKFDSIPSNFLVNPKGVVVAKAIKPDSLEQVVSRFLK